MFRIILAIVTGMLLAAFAHGDVQHAFAAGPTDPFADDSTCDPNARYSGVFYFQYQGGLCTVAEVWTAEALQAVLQEHWTAVREHVRPSDFPCTVFDAVDNWAVFISGQGVFIGAPGTSNVWTTFGGAVVCPPSERIGKDPVSQLAKLQGRTFEQVLAEVITEVNSRVGPQSTMSVTFYRRFYPADAAGFNPKRPTCSHTAVDTNPLSPGFGKDACAFFNW